MAGDKTVHFTEADFESKVLSASGTVMVDFWAEWCGPCKALGPTIDEIAAEYTGKAVVGKLDIDAAQTLAARLNVLSIPTVIVFKNGSEAARIVGARSKQIYRDALNAAIGIAPVAPTA